MHELQQYRAGRVKLVDQEPDPEVRARVHAPNGDILAAIEEELQRRPAAS
jgi:hypothetical protein